MDYVYAALLLHKLGKPVDEEHINKVLHSIGAKVDESKIKSLVASLKDVNIDQELANAVVASASAPVVASAPVEEKKEDKREESAAGLSALFG